MKFAAHLSIILVAILGATMVQGQDLRKQPRELQPHHHGGGHGWGALRMWQNQANRTEGGDTDHPGINRTKPSRNETAGQHHHGHHGWQWHYDSDSSSNSADESEDADHLLLESKAHALEEEDLSVSAKVGIAVATGSAALFVLTAILYFASSWKKNNAPSLRGAVQVPVKEVGTYQDEEEATVATESAM